ncbi:MAG TPA: glycoside hydrolase/phage tail family protein [Hyphomicrobiales bacterium]|nr:glycoside hydrolase/phage tail family protein [Hyphomicrobiales bacterium]
MATLVLQVAGAALGGVFGSVGALIGRAVGGLAGAIVDQSLFAPAAAAPTIKDLTVTASTEGSPIPRLYGRGQLGGQIIWATHLEAVTSSEPAGGKGGAFGGATTETVSYFANFAVGLCEGPIACVRRIWADGNPLDLTGITMRVHRGDDAQEADPLIVAKEAAGTVPAYRGLAYVVFERLPLADFGNRIPQLAFEVVRPVGALEGKVQAITLIPGATEHGYATTTVARQTGFGASEPENRHLSIAPTDWQASLDELEAVCPALRNVSLVVAWFGDDLRCGHCSVAPRVEESDKVTSTPWSVAGLTRATARVVSESGGAPAYGGSPSDDSVVQAIRDLKARGLQVTLYPFLMMDVPVGNALPDPHAGTAPQPAYPWRGTLTCDPAPGVAGTVDATAAAADQVAAFFGTAAPADFTDDGTAVHYGGPDEWGWRRFVLHLAALARLAGGVDAFVVGSEFRELTRVRSASGVYPAVTQFAALAADVRTMLGTGARLVYAADWTEYGAHVLDGGAEVRFPLDPLFASDAVDAVGIDWYAPLADWRDGGNHRDLALAETIYDRTYLDGNVEGGEGYDWFYADAAARDAQDRTPIGDGLGKPWVFRQKDLNSWWSNPHYERVGGAELPSPTAWVPESKPVWLTECGCPAVDKGANAPNVFPDPKSSAGGIPYYSSGLRDDFIQRRVLEAVTGHWDPAAGHNPVSTVYGAPMIDPARIALWTWDARPWPAFPAAISVWADGPAWHTGHWLTGRLGQAPLAELAATAAADSGVSGLDASALEGVVDGVVVGRPASLRDTLQPLADLYAFAAREREDQVALLPRGRGVATALAPADFVDQGDGARPLLHQERGQETELPATLAVNYTEVDADFAPSVATAMVSGTRATGQASIDTAIVSWQGEMVRRAEQRLQDLWVARDTASFSLAPTRWALEAGDMVSLGADTDARFEIAQIADGSARAISARAIAPAVFAPGAGTQSVTARPLRAPSLAAFPEVVLIDMPWAGGDPPTLLRLAVASVPWPRAFTLWRDAGGSFTAERTLRVPAIAGATTAELAAGPPWRWDRAAAITVVLPRGTPVGGGEGRVLAGGNLAAVAAPGGGWEVIQFAAAELVGPDTWRLSTLLRGLAGTEDLAAAAKPAGSRLVMLDRAVVPLVAGIANVGRAMDWRLAQVGRDYADPFAVAASATITNLALQPRRPVMARARRTAGGVSLSWIGRSRGDDSWDVEPALDQPEGWQVAILAGGTVKRTLTASTAAATYAAADELVDFGAAQTSLAVSIAQVSPFTGPGPALEKTLDVR